MLKEEYLVYTNENNDSVYFGYFYDLIPIQLSENIDNNLVLSRYALQNGATFNSSALSERTISIKAVYSIGKAKSIESTIRKVFNPMIKGTFYKYSNHDFKKIEVRLDSTPIITHEKGLGTVEINLIAPSPFYEESKRTNMLAEETPMFRFPICLVGYKPFGTRITQVETIIMNNGDIATGFVCNFKAKGKVLNPSIINNVTGEKIALNCEMVSDDVIKIVNLPFNISVYKNGVKDLSLLNLKESTFYHLNVGKNKLGVGADENLSNLETRIEYIPLFL